MVEAGSITALLKLDASGFNTSLSNSADRVEKFASTMERVGTDSTNFTKGLEKIVKRLEEFRTQLSSFDKLGDFEGFKRLSVSLEKIVNTAIKFNKEGAVTVNTFTQLGNGINAFMNALGGVELKLTNVVRGTQQLVEATSKLSAEEQKESAAARQAASGFERLFNATLDAARGITAANKGIQTTSEALARERVQTSGAAASIKSLNLSLNSTTSYTNKTTQSLDKLGYKFTETSSKVSNFASTYKLSIAQIGESSTAYDKAYNDLMKLTRGIEQFNAISATSNKGTPTVTFAKGLNNGAEELTKNLDKATTSSNNFSRSLNTASSSASTANQRFSGLHQTMGALRTMVSMVGSMFIYNFAHNMMISVQNTVKAKSEMESFLSTMGLGPSRIDSFNAALDRTVERFQRVNKYNIGETVANIGLEFDLSAQEMEKAMSVTSMVTSEYLRAGRNADEAALAVKDIMQGQFQRLSRETGVKQENLIDAGWSGDTSDVLGLMDALEKVAKSRHWDTFAEKASSLNDIILITQNRLSEWAADMSEGITPIVTDAFNLIVAGVDGLTTIFGQLGNALHLPDWTGTALMVGGLVTALAGLLTSTITARTGLGLLDIAHKGLGQSILATIFNIKAEEMENAKATTIIKAKILGLNAEKVAQGGVKGALAESLILEKAESLAKENSAAKIVGKTTSLEAEYFAMEHGLTVQQAKILLEEQDALANMRSYQVILTKIMGLDAEIVANNGLLAALGASKIGRVADALATEGQTVAEETLTAARWAGVAVMSVYLAALLAIAAVAAVFLLPMIQQVQTATEHMSTFNKLINDGDTMIKEAREDVQSYSEQVQKLSDEIDSGNLSFEESIEKHQQLAEAQRNLRMAEQELEDTRSAVEQARSSRAKSEEAREKSAKTRHDEMIKTLQELGYNYDQAADKASKYYGVLETGTGVERELANHEAWNNGRVTDKNNELMKQLKGKEDPEVTAKRIQDNVGIIDAQNKQYQKMLESESLGEYVEGYLGWKWYQGVEGITDFQNALAAGDWNKVGGDIGFMVSELVGLNDVAGLLREAGLGPIIDEVGNIFGEEWDKTVKGIGNIGNIFGDLDKWITDGLNQINNIDVGKILSDWWNGLFSGGSDGGGLQMQNIGQNIMPMMTEFVVGICEGIANFDWSSITSFLTVNPLDLILNGIFGEGTSDNVNAFIQAKIIQPLMNLPSAIQGYLSQAVSNFVSFGTQLLSYGLSAGSNFLNGVITHISQLPSRVYSFITQTGSSIISGAVAWASNARSKATETVNAVVTTVSQLPQKVYNEFVKIGDRIRQAIEGAVQSALAFGTAIKDAVLGALRIFSPGIVQQKIAQEFADIPSRISEQNANAESQASSFGQSIVSGMDSQMGNVTASATALTDAMNQTQPDVVLDGSFVGDYQTDANVISGINQTMSMDTTTTFGILGDTVNSTISGMSTNLQTSYTNMNLTQNTALANMQSNNTNAYNKLQTTTTTSLNNMRNTTQNVTLQMVNAWDHMKDNIISSANQLKTQSTAHFNTLSDHIGTFYRKLQNPSMWGAGDKVPTRHYNASRGHRGINAVKRTFGVTPPRKGYAGGYDFDSLPQRTTVRKLKQLIGANPIFNGMDLDQEVDVREFLGMFNGSFGWNDWHPNHFNRIKNTSGDWKMKGPQIMHRIDTGETFQVKEFYNSQPQISFASFQHMAEALFSAIPYDLYFNSDKYGSWQAALQAGSCNCYDGANALIALAATCGFSGTLAHGTWNGIPHVYAIINGKKMDTTGWQNRRDWNGVSAGGPSNMSGFGNKTVNVNIDMSNSTFNGEDDFRDKMRNIAQEVIQEEVNASITVGI